MRQLRSREMHFPALMPQLIRVMKMTIWRIKMMMKTMMKMKTLMMTIMMIMMIQMILMRMRASIGFIIAMT